MTSRGLPPRDQVGPNTPLRLDVAAAMAYPDGSKGPRDLRMLAFNGALAFERVAGRLYTTLGFIREMTIRECWNPGGIFGVLGSIYVLGFDDYVKIGWTRGRAADRVSEIEQSLPKRATLYGTFYGTIEAERSLHEAFQAQRIRGEWFARSGAVETWIAAGCPTRPWPRA